MKDKVLCIEDDPTFQALVSASLKDQQVLCAPHLSKAKDLLKQHQFAAILVDIELPDGDGLRFLSDLGQEFPECARLPLFVMSGHDQISNKVMAFSIGAEDFISKPFDPIELSARVSAKIRRNKAVEGQNQRRNHGNLLIDFDRQKAFRVDVGLETDLQLTSIELKILGLLTKRLDQVYSREQILNQVWGETYVSDRTVDSHVAHLRQKIEGTQLAIETSKNFGYRASLKS